MNPTLPPIRHHEAAAQFEVSLDDGMGVCQYRREDGLLQIVHTEVPPSAAGRGIAGALVQAVLDWARAEGMKVQPLCDYAASYIRRRPEQQDLLA